MVAEISIPEVGAWGYFVLLMPVFVWLASIWRLRRVPSPAESLRIVVLSPARTRWLVVGALLLMCLGAAATRRRLLEGVGPPTLSSLIMIAICLTYVIRVTTPPLVLLLSASGPHSKQEMVELKFSLWPGRVVGLLRRASESFNRNLVDVDNVAERALGGDNMRADGDGWREHVGELAAMAAVVILDLRQRNEAVDWEMQFIAKGQFAAKTVFVVDDHKERALFAERLKGFGLNPSHLAIVRAILLQDVMRRLMRASIRDAGAARKIAENLSAGDMADRAAKRCHPGGANCRLLRYVEGVMTSARGALRAGHFLESLLPSVRAEVFLRLLNTSPIDKVRENCLVHMQGLDLGEADLRDVVEALQDCSALVRRQAASFIGIRGMQKKPLMWAIPQLLNAAADEPELGDDPEEEEIAWIGLPEVLAAAIKSTVGARVLQVNIREFGHVQFEADLRNLVANSTEPVIQEDARRYLAAFYSEPASAGVARGRIAEGG